MMESLSFSLAMLALSGFSFIAAFARRSNSRQSSLASNNSGCASKHRFAKSSAMAYDFISLAAAAARSKALSWVGLSSKTAIASTSASSHLCKRNLASERLARKATCSASPRSASPRSRARVHFASASWYLLAAKSVLPSSLQAWAAARAASTGPSGPRSCGSGGTPLNLRHPAPGGNKSSDRTAYRGLPSWPRIHPYESSPDFGFL
mmetsp:Transcript_67866/g.150327  ORF Transcript_67866/g.150327 Transcript_67866/m.150327 type:complete len:207 (+) Transcript_67866:972-1592(+)